MKNFVFRENMRKMFLKKYNFSNKLTDFFTFIKLLKDLIKLMEFCHRNELSSKDLISFENLYTNVRKNFNPE